MLRYDGDVKILPISADTEDNRRVLEYVQKAVEGFARLGCDAINALCNERRAFLLSKVNRAFLNEYGLSDVSPEQAKRELAFPFELQHLPGELAIDFSVPS